MGRFRCLFNRSKGNSSEIVREHSSHPALPIGSSLRLFRNINSPAQQIFPGLVTFLLFATRRILSVRYCQDQVCMGPLKAVSRFRHFARTRATRSLSAFVSTPFSLSQGNWNRHGLSVLLFWTPVKEVTIVKL